MGLVNLAQAIITRTSINPGEDVAIFTSHWRVVLAAQPDNAPMDDAMRTAATTLLKTFWTTCGGKIFSGNVLTSIRWYDVPDAAPHKPVFAREDTFTGIAAVGSAPLAPQSAISVTFKTDARKQWGRFYLPQPAQSAVDANGYLTTANCDSIATAAALLTKRDAAGTPKPTLTVWSPTKGERNDPQKVQVDNVLDVIRSRRFKVTTYRKTINAG